MGPVRWVRRMTRYDVNEEAAEERRALIGGRQYVLDSESGDVQPSVQAANAYVDRYVSNDYAAWYLGLTGGCER